MRVWMTKQDKSITNIKLQIAALCEKSYKNCRFLVFSTMRGYRQYATLIKDIEHNTPSSVHLAFGPFEAMPQNYVDNFDAIILVAGDGESALKMLGGFNLYDNLQKSTGLVVAFGSCIDAVTCNDNDGIKLIPYNVVFTDTDLHVPNGTYTDVPSGTIYVSVEQTVYWDGGKLHVCSF